MKIAINNKMTPANGALVVVQSANVLFDINNLMKTSFAYKYVDAGTDQTYKLEYTFTTPTLIDYVGLAGHNAGESGADVTIATDGNTQLFVQYLPANFADFSTVLMATFPPVLVTVISITFFKTAQWFSSNKIAIANIQAGDTFALTNPVNDSERSGYVRPWIEPGVSDTAILNRKAEPVVSLVRQRTKRLTLTLTNIQGISQNPDFDQLLQFIQKMTSEDNQTTWFMQERDGTVLPQDNTSDYLCYNGELIATAGTNRLLNSLKISFNAYIGIRG